MARVYGRILTIFMLNAALVLAGCSSYQHPSVEVTGVRLGEVTDEAAALQFSVNMHNPNNEPLTLLEFEYGLHVDGRKVYEGKRAAETVLATRGSKQVTIPAIIRFDATEPRWSPEAMPDEAQFSLNGKLKYITPGKIAEVLFDLGVKRPTVQFSDEGRVRLASTP